MFQSNNMGESYRIGSIFLTYEMCDMARLAVTAIFKIYSLKPPWPLLMWSAYV
jgi:hypothetical protein